MLSLLSRALIPRLVPATAPKAWKPAFTRRLSSTGPDGVIRDNLPDISPYPYQPLTITEDDYRELSGMATRCWTCPSL